MSRAYTFEAVAERLACEPKPLRLAASRLLLKSGLCCVFTIPRPGYRLRFYPSAYSSLLWLDPAASMQDEQVLRNVLRPGDNVVDVGANIGTLALCAASAVGESGHVLAMEAHPRTFGFLQGNLRLNQAQNVEALHLAAGDVEGRISITDASGHSISVPMRTLDQLLPGFSPVRLLRIDVEGFELAVLRGAGSLLQRTEYVYLECWDRHVERYGFRLPEVMRLLAAAGLEPFRFTREHHLVRVREQDAFPVCENVLAVRDWRTTQDETGLEFEVQHAEICHSTAAAYTH